MEQKIINKAKKMLANADTGTNDCKNYNNGFMDGVKYAIKALIQPPVSGSVTNNVCQCGADIPEDDLYDGYCVDCG